jgi:hypothetical protein
VIAHTRIDFADVMFGRLNLDRISICRRPTKRLRSIDCLRTVFLIPGLTPIDNRPKTIGSATRTADFLNEEARAGQGHPWATHACDDPALVHDGIGIGIRVAAAAQ